MVIRILGKRTFRDMTGFYIDGFGVMAFGKHLAFMSWRAWPFFFGLHFYLTTVFRIMSS